MKILLIMAILSVAPQKPDVHFITTPDGDRVVINSKHTILALKHRDGKWTKTFPHTVETLNKTKKYGKP